MNFWKKLFGKRPTGQVEPSSISVPDQLHGLLKKFKVLEEPKYDGIPTKEYYTHLSCAAFASLLAELPHANLPQHEIEKIKQKFQEYVSTDCNGLDFKHPWEERTKILKQMYQLAFSSPNAAGVGGGKIREPKPTRIYVARCMRTPTPEEGYKAIRGLLFRFPVLDSQIVVGVPMEGFLVVATEVDELCDNAISRIFDEGKHPNAYYLDAILLPKEEGATFIVVLWGSDLADEAQRLMPGGTRR